MKPSKVFSLIPIEILRRISQIYSRVRLLILDLLFLLNSARETRLIPRPSRNYNQHVKNVLSLKKYKHDFVTDSVNLQLPFLQNIAGLSESSMTLDFGCGLGRLAYAFELDPSSGRYLGWEPEKKALAWLKKSYEFNPRFRFEGAHIPAHLNYVTNQSGSKLQTSESVGELNLVGLEDAVSVNSLDLIVSHSVFTHMWPEDAQRTINRLSSLSHEATTMVHTWLILDSISVELVKEGLADRELPFEVREIFTYSLENPLVCTAYPLELLKRIYRDAGQEITSIFWGSWSGRGASNGFSYQDVVTSQKI